MGLRLGHRARQARCFFIGPTRTGARPLLAALRYEPRPCALACPSISFPVPVPCTPVVMPVVMRLVARTRGGNPGSLATPINQRHAAMMTVNDYLAATRDAHLRSYEGMTFISPRPHIVCDDGLTLSVQAGPRVYAKPQSTSGPYDAVEVGFPSEPIDALMPYISVPDGEPTKAVYPYVPVTVVDRILRAHGGIDPDATFTD